MSGNIFGSEDPWANGWATEDDPRDPGHDNTDGRNLNDPLTSPFTSTYLTSSQVLSSNNDDYDNDQATNFVFEELKVPESYKEIYRSLHDQLRTGSDFERMVLDKLVQDHKFLGYQKTKIINTIYDHDLSDVTNSSQFYQCLGLVALEIDLEGTGDFVTLQFKLNDLPEIPQPIKQLIISSSSNEVEFKETSGTSSSGHQFVDPLTGQLANSKLEDDGEWNERQSNKDDSFIGSDPILTDHSSIAHPEQGHDPSHTQSPAAFSDLNKYINEYRDKFKPLFDGNDVINVKEVPEKEGLVFKHINYAISHEINLGMNSPAGIKKVIRRYSDFVWYVKKRN